MAPLPTYGQRVAEAAAELVGGVVRRQSTVQLQVVRIQYRRRIVLSGGGENRRIEIDHFRECVIGPERQSVL